MKICLTGGGTLGSVTPLLALTEALQGESFFWIGTETGPERAFVDESRIPFMGIPAMKLRRYFSVATLREIPRLFSAISHAKKILQQQKPSCVITAGSYVSVPVCYAAKTLGIPYIVVQLDVHVGLANRLVGKRALRIFSAIQDHAGFFSAPVTICGIPTSDTFNENEKHDASRTPTLCVLGGGTGSVWLNNFVAEKADELLACADVIHIQGASDRTIAVTKKNSSHAYISESVVSRKKLAAYFNTSTVILSRSGMGTIADMAAAKKAAILVPMPNSHQEENARYVASHGAAVYHDQKEGFDNLITKIVQLFESPTKREKLGLALNKLFPSDASKTIATFIKETIK